MRRATGFINVDIDSGLAVDAPARADGLRAFQKTQHRSRICKTVAAETSLKDVPTTRQARFTACVVYLVSRVKVIRLRWCQSASA